MIDIINEDIFSPITIVLRLFCATFAGFLIGFEREKHNQAAGLRTHMVLSLGASLIMILSLYIPFEFLNQGTNADPGRLAAQVISGIGFLGAGAIFRYGFSVKGLTTAASIWTTSGIGLTFGSGFYFLGFVSTLFLIAILYVFDKIENMFIEQRKLRVISIIFASKYLTPQKVINTVINYDITLKHFSITESIEDRTTEIVINCRVDEDFGIHELFDGIKSLGYIKKIRID